MCAIHCCRTAVQPVGETSSGLSVASLQAAPRPFPSLECRAPPAGALPSAKPSDGGDATQINVHQLKRGALCHFIHSECGEIICAVITIRNLLTPLMFISHWQSSSSERQTSVRRNWAADKRRVPRRKKDFWSRRDDWCFCCRGKKGTSAEFRHQQ